MSQSRTLLFQNGFLVLYKILWGELKLLGEERGKVIGTRVLSVDADSHKVETSFQARGKILGIEYEVVERTLYSMSRHFPLKEEGKDSLGPRIGKLSIGRDK